MALLPRLRDAPWGVDRFVPRLIPEILSSVFEVWNLLDAIMRMHSRVPWQTGYVREVQVRRMLELASQSAGEMTYCEVGLNGGHSAAAMLLSSPNVTAHVFDLLEYRYSASVATLLRVRFGSRFQLHPGNSRDMLLGWSAVFVDAGYRCDLVLVDGDHTYLGTRKDIIDLRLAAADGAWLVVDDVVPECNPAKRSGAADEAYCAAWSRAHPHKKWDQRVIGPGIAVRNLIQLGVLLNVSAEMHGPHEMGSPFNPCLRAPSGPVCSPIFDWGFAVVRYAPWKAAIRSKVLDVARTVAARPSDFKNDRRPKCRSASCVHVQRQILKRAGAWRPANRTVEPVSTTSLERLMAS